MANDGEERLSTVYADVHYWFSEPSARPTGHRFDKGCYVYLYRHQVTSRGRLEIANHAGTPEQDAFTGYLDNAKISQSHKQPNLVTIVVDGHKLSQQAASQSTEWRLPSTDPRDEGKYLFRLHTLDVYFWTKEDATSFIQHLQHTLQPQQLDVDYPVTEPHQDLASPVVQKLENMAVSDPAYSHDRRSIATSSTAPSTRDERKDSANFAPLAYNPAAPAAPEKRAHREKTPPPPEEPGVGLAHAVNDDHRPGVHSHQPYTGIPTTSSPYSPTPSSHSIASPPASTAPTSHSYAAPPKAPPKDQHSHLHQHLPLESPTAQILGPSYLTSPTVPLQHIQPQYPDYLAQRQSSPYTPGHYHQGQYYPTNTGDQDIHSQVYIPNEEDGRTKPGKPGQAGPGTPGAGKWEQKAEKAEKGLNRLLRKVEKKIG